MTRSFLRLLSFLALALLPGCGLHPSALLYVAETNRTTPLAGIILDETGRPLGHVDITVAYNRVQWTLLSTASDYPHQTNHVPSTFFIRVPGRVSYVTFSKDGFYSQRFYLQENLGAILKEEGDHPHPPNPRPFSPTNLSIVLRKKGPLTPLRSRMDTLWIDAQGRGVVMDPAKPESDWTSALWTPSVELAPPGYLYLSAKRDDRGIPAVKVLEQDERPCYKPVEIRLGIANCLPGDGILLFSPSNPANFWIEMRRAPTSGYLPQVILDPSARQQLAHNRPVWFFVKSRGTYSRGYLTDWSLGLFDNNHFTQYGARVFLTTQPDGTPNLELGD